MGNATGFRNLKRIRITILGRMAVLLFCMSAGVLLSGRAGEPVLAAEKTAMNHQKITLQAGGQKTIKVRNAVKKVSWKTTNKKIAVVKKTTGKKKASAVIFAKKKGNCKIIARVGKKQYFCKVAVKAKKIPVNTQDVPSEPTSPVTKGAAGAYVTSVAATSSSITVDVVLYNGLDEEIVFGMGYLFEKWDGIAWKALGSNSLQMIPAIAIILKPQKQNSMKYVFQDPLEPITSGRYRILTDLPVSEHCNNAAEFDVVLP